MKETTPLTLPVDLETPEAVRALAYLDAITAHFLEFGPLEEKTAFDVAYEVSYHNAWQQYEVEQERKAGEPLAVYREIHLLHLHALSTRKLLAFQARGEQGSAAYAVACFVDRLIAQALRNEEGIEQVMQTPPGARGAEDGVPF